MMKIVAAAAGMFAILCGSDLFAQSLREQCEQKSAEIDNLNRELGASSSQLSELENQIRDLMTKKTAESRKKDDLVRRIKSEGINREKICNALKECERQEQKAVEFRTRMEPTQQKLTAIRDGSQKSKTEIGELQIEIQRIANQYLQLDCSNLQIGQTSQSTFDKCGQLNNDGTNLQNRINQFQVAIDQLLKDYQQENTKLRSIQSELKRLVQDLRKACTDSGHIASLETLQKELDENLLLKAQIEDLKSTAKSFRVQTLASGQNSSASGQNTSRPPEDTTSQKNSPAENQRQQ